MISSLEAFDYGSLLIEAKKNEGISYKELRARSSEIVNQQDVRNLDEFLISQVNTKRAVRDLLIDSHAVTREQYGFRVIPFSAAQLQQLNFDAVIALTCDPDVVVERIQNNAEGRRHVSVEMAREHQHMQEAVALNYGISCGCPIFVLDSTNSDEQELTRRTIEILRKIGMSC